jgi:serine-type D-Ala-D-Ala carboxypeptidase (penicillin-binding protein 5/6)
VTIVASVLTTTVGAAPAGAQAAPAVPDGCGPAPATAWEVLAAEWILVDADTGGVTACQRHHDPVLPASTVKLMTALTAVERLPPGTLVEISPLAAAQPANRIGLVAGQRWPVEDLLAAALVESANDAAYALAEAAGGSLDGWVAAATDLGRRLGLRDATFGDPAGLNGAEGHLGGSRVSAYDLAVLARAVLARPDLAALVASTQLTITGPDGASHVLTNRNKMLQRYPGAIGVKPGYTVAAGNTLVVAARRDGRTMLVVVLGAQDLYGSATALLDFGFATPVGPPRTGEGLPAVGVVTSPPVGPSGPAAPDAAPNREPPLTHQLRFVTASAGLGSGLFARFLLVVGLFGGVLVVMRRRTVVRRRRLRRARLEFEAAQKSGFVQVCSRDPLEDADGPRVRVHRVADRPSLAAAASPVRGRPGAAARPRATADPTWVDPDRDRHSARRPVRPRPRAGADGLAQETREIQRVVLDHDL